MPPRQVSWVVRRQKGAMIPLEANPTDDGPFLDLAGRLIVGAALANGFSDVVAVHIDHWFGERWLGFCGKLLGSAGVRSRRLDGELTPPPFHPHRVLSARVYRLTEANSFEHWDDAGSLHGYRPSQANINRTFRRNRVYAWYSGDTAATDKGVVMVYLVHRKWSAAWYAGFDRFPQWHLSVTRAISPGRVQELLELSAPEQRHTEPGAAPDTAS
jgi:hypothetical protein